MGRLIACALVTVALVLAGRTALRDDDRPVDPANPAAQRAIAAAHEVELDPATMSLLRVDYD